MDTRFLRVPGFIGLDCWPTRQMRCEPILGALRRVALSDGDSSAWGYHFPVHTRFFSYEPTTPNLIVTAFVAKGLAAVTARRPCGLPGGSEERSDLRPSRLPRVTDETGQCIGYVQGEPAVVHNANMLAALVLCDAADACGEEAWVEEALACARFTVARQAADGSWPYSEEPYGRWVDGFHTGFVLEGLARVVAATGDDGLRASLGRGVDFYVAQLFGPAVSRSTIHNGRGRSTHSRPPRAWRPSMLRLAARQAARYRASSTGSVATSCAPDGRVAYQVHRALDRLARVPALVERSRSCPRWPGLPHGVTAA